MTARVVGSAAEAKELIGVELGPSEPVLVDQHRIDLFAQATGDFQWIHVDAERAAAGPFGTTIAHGYLTVSLVPWFAAQLYRLDFGTARLNYGSDKVRFPTPVPVDSTLTATARFVDVREESKGTFITAELTITADGAQRPACVAQTIVLVRN